MYSSAVTFANTAATNISTLHKALTELEEPVCNFVFLFSLPLPPFPQRVCVSVSVLTFFCIAVDRWWVFCLFINETDQPINQSINQSTNESINQTSEQSINQSINWSIDQTEGCKSFNQSINLSIERSNRRLQVIQSINQSITFYDLSMIFLWVYDEVNWFVVTRYAIVCPLKFASTANRAKIAVLMTWCEILLWTAYEISPSFSYHSYGQSVDRTIKVSWYDIPVPYISGLSPLLSVCRNSCTWTRSRASCRPQCHLSTLHRSVQLHITANRSQLIFCAKMNNKKWKKNHLWWKNEEKQSFMFKNEEKNHSWWKNNDKNHSWWKMKKKTIHDEKMKKKIIHDEKWRKKIIHDEKMKKKIIHDGKKHTELIVLVLMIVFFIAVLISSNVNTVLLLFTKTHTYIRTLCAQRVGYSSKQPAQCRRLNLELVHLSL